MRIELTEEQQQLRERIEDNLAITKLGNEYSTEEIKDAFEKMKKAAHELHMQLEPKPTHHRQMIENRMMEPTDPEFYNHIHPVEDLLAYLDDTSANDDPEDITMNNEFRMEIYSNRWGHYDTYLLRRVAKGWHVEHLSYSGVDELEGDMEVLTSAMRHDNISYPSSIDYYMRSVWMRAKDEGLNHEQVQDYLNQIGEWISSTEKYSPQELLL